MGAVSKREHCSWGESLQAPPGQALPQGPVWPGEVPVVSLTAAQKRENRELPGGQGAGPKAVMDLGSGGSLPFLRPPGGGRAFLLHGPAVENVALSCGPRPSAPLWPGLRQLESGLPVPAWPPPLTTCQPGCLGPAVEIVSNL